MRSDLLHYQGIALHRHRRGVYFVVDPTDGRRIYARARALLRLIDAGVIPSATVRTRDGSPYLRKVAM